MARLLGTDIPTVQSDRWGAVRRCVDTYGATVVLKGYGPLVGSPESAEIVHVPAGSTALAKGGSGDLLSGLIGGLLAQGLGPREAAILATFVGGLASDLLARDRSPRATIIRDVAEFLPAAFRQLENAQRTR
jgi:NAD(P)H-hydrate epimerase